VGVPTNIHGITDALRDPAYATSVGLLLWGAKNQGRRKWNNGGGFFGRIKNLLSGFKNLFR
jgi:cell division protein FtsA